MLMPVYLLQWAATVGFAACVPKQPLVLFNKPFNKVL
jgi:hypothetical protein